MKIKTSIKVTVVLSIVIIILAQVYLSFGLPVLNLLYNQNNGDLNNNNEEAPVIIHGDSNLLDVDDPIYNTTPDPNETEEPAPTEIVPLEPGQMGTSQDIRASQVRFKDGTMNVLLLGYNPEEGLSDSIFILNIDQETHLMKLYSIPRDTYVPHSKETQEIMKKNRYYYSPGSFKLNACTYIGRELLNYKGGKFGVSGIDFMCAIISQLLPGCEIDEYVYVDFDGFMKLIDIVGGVDITSPENMYEWNGKLMVEKGRVHINAEQALFYVRHRHRYDSTGKDTFTGGDNYRKENQLNFLVEISRQFITLDNVKHMGEMLDSLSGSVFHSLSAGDLVDYMPIATDYANGYYSIQPYLIKGKSIDPFGDNACYYKLD